MSPQQHPLAILTSSFTLDLLVHGRQSDTRKHDGDGGGWTGFPITVIAQFTAQASELLSSRASKDPWYLRQKKKKLKPQAINAWVVRSMYHFCEVNYFMHKV